MRINYLSFGKKGKPIVFLHGWQQDKASFFPLVPYLYKSHRLYLLDLPGFGKSKIEDFNLDLDDYASNIYGWIRRNRIAPVVLVGHSFGGKIAALIAGKYPNVVSHLVLVGSAGFKQGKIRYRFLRYLPSEIKKMLFSVVGKHFVSRDYLESGKLLPVFKNIIKQDLSRVYTEIKRPTLIVWGKADQELPVKEATKVHRLIATSKLQLFEAGHFVHVEKPEIVANSIISFIKDEKT